MWNSTRRKLGTPAFAAAAVVSLGAWLGAPSWADAADNSAPAADPTAPAEFAVWTPKEVQFTYMGFTTHYTCDGLRDAVRDMVLQLGARKSDLKVTEQPCSGQPDRPNPFPGVRIKMSVLQPAPAQLAPDAQVVEAHWKPVKLPYRETGINAAGQCELLEQFNQKIMPLFTTRNVDLRATCVPHQLEPLGTKLQAEVLITDQKKDVAKQASAADAR
jgi:hypothetical protein